LFLPLQAAPVIVKTVLYRFRCIVVEGVHVGKKLFLVLTCLTASTKIIDVTGDEPVEMKGFVPARSVVIQEAIPKFAAGDFQVPCAIIIGTRKPSH
jgi:2,3,4,5-tetrahydropyridine-2-carboxylate N-succinyltransferase